MFFSNDHFLARETLRYQRVLRCIKSKKKIKKKQWPKDKEHEKLRSYFTSFFFIQINKIA